MKKAFYWTGVVFNVKHSIISICQNIIVFVGNLKTPNTIGIFNLTLVVNLARKKEGNNAHIYVINYAIAENANPVTIKAQ